METIRISALCLKKSKKIEEFSNPTNKISNGRCKMVLNRDIFKEKNDHILVGNAIEKEKIINIDESQENIDDIVVRKLNCVDNHHRDSANIIPDNVLRSSERFCGRNVNAIISCGCRRTISIYVTEGELEFFRMVGFKKITWDTGANFSLFRGLFSNQPEVFVRGKEEQIENALQMIRPVMSKNPKFDHSNLKHGLSQRILAETKTSKSTTRLSLKVNLHEASRIVGINGEVIKTIMEDSKAVLALETLEESKITQLNISGSRPIVKKALLHPIVTHILRLK